MEDTLLCRCRHKTYEACKRTQGSERTPSLDRSSHAERRRTTRAELAHDDSARDGGEIFIHHHRTRSQTIIKQIGSDGTGRRLAHPGAVDVWADGVGDADSALGRDACGVSKFEATHPAGGGLEAVACGAPVGGAPGRRVEAPHAAAAGCGGAGAGAAGVGDAGADGRAHLPAGHGGLGGRRRGGEQHDGGNDGDSHHLMSASHCLDCA